MAANGALLRYRVLLGVTDTVEGCQNVIQVLCLRVTSPAGLLAGGLVFSWPALWGPASAVLL